MAYTPDLSYMHSCTFRRLAWALGIQMTKAIGEFFHCASKTLDNETV